MAKEWKDVTNYFSESRRHYNGKYLELDLVLEEKYEIQRYVVIDGDFEADYEIFVNVGKYYGSIYTNEPDRVFEEVKNEIYKESFKKNKFNVKFYEKLRDKYGLGLYNDAFFNLNL